MDNKDDESKVDAEAAFVKEGQIAEEAAVVAESDSERSFALNDNMDNLNEEEKMQRQQTMNRRK